MIIKISKTIFIILAFFIFTNLSAQNEYHLKYNYNKGETYQYSNSMDMNAVIEMMGQEVKSGSVANIFMKFKVEDVKDNKNLILITSIDSGSVKVSSPMKDTTISLDFIAGKRTKIELSQHGKLVNKELIDSVNNPMLGGAINQENFRLYRFPENKIKVGETWSVQDTVSQDMMGGKITSITNTNSTLVGKEEKLGYDCLKITFTGDTKSEGNTNMMGQKLFLEGAGKISGTVYFEPVKGFIVQSESNIDMDMTMATTGEQNMIIPMTQSLKNTMTIVK